MVNKMNLKISSIALFFITFCTYVHASDLGMDIIKHRGYVSCGISEDYKALANKIENHWQGFDVDICRAIATAIIGNADSFKLINVKKEKIGEALNSGTIDIMLGHNSLSAAEELKMYINPLDILFFDRQIFTARQSTNASSMRDFAGLKVCVLRNSMYSIFLHEYNQKYALGFKILEMPSLSSVKEGFYLKRCDLASGDEIFIKSITKELKSEDTAQLLPEEIAYIPIKAYSAGNNPTLTIALRWIINGLKLAYASDISSQTIDTFNATKSQSIKNLLGYNDKAWKTLKVDPEWIKSYIKEYGNYQQILEKNIGKISPLELNIKQNDLVEKGGLISYVPFI